MPDMNLPLGYLARRSALQQLGIAHRIKPLERSPMSDTPTLRDAAEAPSLRADRDHRGTWVAAGKLVPLYHALRAALSAEAAWRARAEAAIEVADALWGVDVAWMAYEPSDDPSAPPNASQKRHTAAVARLNAARHRYEEMCRG